jgi:deoxycytidylate deaminase
MKYFSEEETKKAQKYIDECVKQALNSTCQRSRCGSIIVKDEEIIGKGFNSPPANKEEQRRCSCSKEDYAKKVTDKTCCVHAEQRAIMEALRNNSNKLINSRLYFIRLDEKGNRSFSGKPYCTICSKMALDVGISEFVLLHKEGICAYNTDEYNLLSFNYKE